MPALETLRPPSDQPPSTGSTSPVIMDEASLTRKTIGPTNSRGSRVRAKAAAGSVTVPWDHALNPPENHDAAAIALAEKYHWLDDGWELAGGGLDGDGYAYVLVKG